MKRIAVTGGLGFIGTNLVPRLQQALGAEVRILDNGYNPSGDLELNPGIDLVTGDIRDPSAVDQMLEGVDGVVHLAAHTRVLESIAEPVENYDINVNGSMVLLEAMRRHGIRSLVNASTGGAILGEVEPPIRENMAARPAAPYGASKLAVEGYCSAYAQSYGMDIVSLRFSNIYGPHSRNKGSVVASFIKQIVEKGEVTVYGDGTQTRDYLFVSDLVGGIIAALRDRCTGVFQLGSGKPTNLLSLIDILKDVTEQDFNIRFENFRVGEVKNTYCDITCAEQAFNFKPGTKLRDGVAETWQWFQSQELIT